MDLVPLAELVSRRSGAFEGLKGSSRACFAASDASFEAALRSQDAPRVSGVSIRRLAMTRLASPNRLNSCASFFARPL